MPFCAQPPPPLGSRVCDANVPSFMCARSGCACLQVLPPYEVLTIQVSSDDTAAVYIDDVAVMNSACCGALIPAAPTTVKAGFHKMAFVFVQLGGTPNFTFEMGFNGSAYAAIPPWRVSPVPLGAAVPVTLTVNGLAVPATCGAATLNPIVPSGTIYTSATAAEPKSASVPAGTCGFMFSSVHSPSNMSLQVCASWHAVVAVAGSTPTSTSTRAAPRGPVRPPNISVFHSTYLFQKSSS